MTAPQRSLLFFYTETPLHAGSGEGLGAIDLPLQRERWSELPQVQGSGIKGALREVVRNRDPAFEVPLFGPRAPDPERGPAKQDAPRNERETQAHEHAGALIVTDARLLLLPVRTARGGWAWITSPLILQRLARDLDGSSRGRAPDWAKLAFGPEAESPSAFVAKKDVIVRNDELIIEDALYRAAESSAVTQLAELLATFLPDTDVYAPTRARLPNQLAVLSDEEMSYWAKHGTEIATRVRIDDDTGTVEDGALWTEEALPSESLLWSVIVVSDSRQPKEKRQPEKSDANALHKTLTDALAKRPAMFLGGDRTVGRGVVAVRIHPLGGVA